MSPSGVGHFLLEVILPLFVFKVHCFKNRYSKQNYIRSGEIYKSLPIKKAFAAVHVYQDRTRA